MSESFGSFQIGRELAAENGATVYKAQKEGDPKGEYVVKVFSLERLLSEEHLEAKSELDPLFKDIGGVFTHRVNLQKQAAETSPHFAPILAAGHDARGAWYATRYYARSAQGMLERLVAVEAADIFHIVRSLVRAARHLQQTAGRSHGNLKPANIFIAGSARPRRSRIVLTDPLAGDAKEAARCELADLRAIGELIYQLVLRRKMDFTAGWVMLPLEPSREWTQLFGKKTPGWLALCNRLLDRNLSLDTYSLRQLEADLRKLRPRPPLALAAAPVVVLVLAGGAAAWWLTRPRGAGILEVSTDPPGGLVILTRPADPRFARTNTAPFTATALESGNYLLRATYQIEGEWLPETRRTVLVQPGKTTNVLLTLPYGKLVVTTVPEGARFRFRNQDRTTPYTNALVKPGPLTLELSLEDHYPLTLTTNIATNAVTHLHARLQKLPPGQDTVEFVTAPPGATIYTNSVRAGETTADGLRVVLEEGKHAVRAELKGWPAQTREVVVPKRGRTPRQEFKWEHGTLTVRETSPPDLQILVNGEPRGAAPRDLYLPYGSYTVAFVAPYHEGVTNVFALSAQSPRQEARPALKPLAGLVEVSTEPGGALITIGNLRTNTPRDGAVSLSLLPGTYEVEARLSFLDPKARKLEVAAGRATALHLKLDHGTVLFTNMQPPEAQVLRDGKTPVTIGEPAWQKPGQTVTYQVRAERYETALTNVTVAADQTVLVTARLARQRVPVKLVSNLEGAEFFLVDGTPLSVTNGLCWLPWGDVRLVARHPRYPRLGALTNAGSLAWSTAPQNFAEFPFRFGELWLTNLPPDVTVSEAGQPVGTAADRFVLEPLGSHTYTLRDPYGAEQITTNLVAGVNLLKSARSDREWRNGAGMVLVRVRGLPGVNGDVWVGQTEVTERQFQEVAGQNPTTEKRGDDYPVRDVSWAEAKKFCEDLTRRPERPPGFPPTSRYTLPTLEQWKFLAKDDNPEQHAVIAAGTLAAVKSKQPNPFGLYDLRGNVREWLEDNANGNRLYTYESYAPMFGRPGPDTLTRTEDRPETHKDPKVGFRVILVP